MCTFSLLFSHLYAPNCRQDRKAIWDEILEVKSSVNAPMIVMGDLNEVLYQDKQNGGSCCYGSMEEMRNWIQEMGVVDLPIHGKKYTWGRGRSRSRLDRMLAEPEWSMTFPDMLLKVLPCSISDHTALVLELDRSNGGPKPFRSLDTWFTHPGFTKMVKQEWMKLGDISIVQKLKQLKSPLKKWNKEAFGNIDNAINKFENDLLLIEKKIKENKGDDTDLARIQALKA